MARHNGRIVFIDGFAGPGRYVGGEDGSPLIAVKTLLDHPHFQGTREQREVVFIFIEKDADRAAALEGELRDLSDGRRFPAWMSYSVLCGEFAPVMSGILDSVAERGRPLAPTFAFIDPFGFAGVPLALVRRIMANPRCECLITFMYEYVNRFVGHPEAGIQAHFDDLFGTDQWRTLIVESDPERRRDGLVSLYRRQLIDKAGARHVRSFEMLNAGNRTEYFLYFATNNVRGLSKMKQAMWKADPVGGQVFSDLTDPRQMVLLDPAPDLAPLRRALWERFHARGWVNIADVERFVLEDTPYSEAIHLKRRTLAHMEKKEPPRIEVRRPSGKRARSGEYPPTTHLHFF